MWKLTHNNSNLDLVKVNAYAKLDQIHWFVHKILSGIQILTIARGHNCDVYLQKLTHNNPNLDRVNVNAYAKFGLTASTPFQDIEWKWYSDDNQGP